MKRSGMFLFLLVALALPLVSRAQVAVYGEFTGAQLQGGPQGDNLFGVTTGVLFEGATTHHLKLSADIEGRFLSHSGERLDSVTVGPRIGFGHLLGFSPYVGFNVGFGRYNNGAGFSTTDNLYGAQGGLTHHLSNRFDVVLDYQYNFYGYNTGFYQPQTYSAGLIYHFGAGSGAPARRKK